MSQEVCVEVVSRDRPRRVDTVGLRDQRVHGIKPGDGSVRGPQETVTRDCVTVGSRYRSLRVDAGGLGAYGEEGRAYGARGIKRCEGAVACSQEGVKRRVTVSVE